MIKPVQVFEFDSNTPQLSHIVDLQFGALTTTFSQNKMNKNKIGSLEEQQWSFRQLKMKNDNSQEVESYQVFLYLIWHSYSLFSHYLPHLSYLVSMKSFIADQHEKKKYDFA